MITLLEEKRIGDRFYLNFSLDAVYDLRYLPHHNKPWASLGFNYGIPLPGSTATLEDLGTTYYLGEDQIWHKVGEGGSPEELQKYVNEIYDSISVMGGAIPDEKTIQNVSSSITTIPHVYIEDGVDTLIYDGGLL